jgi:hypothetical protein
VRPAAFGDCLHGPLRYSSRMGKRPDVGRCDVAARSQRAARGGLDPVFSLRRPLVLVTTHHLHSSHRSSRYGGRGALQHLASSRAVHQPVNLNRSEDPQVSFSCHRLGLHPATTNALRKPCMSHFLPHGSFWTLQGPQGSLGDAPLGLVVAGGSRTALGSAWRQCQRSLRGSLRAPSCHPLVFCLAQPASWR